MEYKLLPLQAMTETARRTHVAQLAVPSYKDNLIIFGRIWIAGGFVLQPSLVLFPLLDKTPDLLFQILK